MFELTNHRKTGIKLWLPEVSFIIFFMVLIAQVGNELKVRTSQLKDLLLQSDGKLIVPQAVKA